MDTRSADKLAKKIWDYHHVNHKLKKADCILVLGSHDIRVAKRGAQLFLDGWAPWLIFTGGYGKITKDIWDKPEAEVFAAIAEEMGVPREKMLIENKATNVGENIAFTQSLLAENNLRARRLLIVTKPYYERRAFATFKKQWPEMDIIVTSPQISFEDYPNKDISKDEVSNLMVGDLQRIKIYPERGLQIPQEIPDDVWRAYKQLVEFGYSKHLIK